jgi:hypothetical protein
MPKSAIITLTTAGNDTGPFNLLSDVDSYVTPFETGVAKSSLIAGYTTNLIPDAATIIRVKSNGVCTNYIDLIYPGIPTTTTTTSTTTTTTTTAPPPPTTTSTTTTTTTPAATTTSTTTTTTTPAATTTSTTTTTTTAVSTTTSTTTTTTTSSGPVLYTINSGASGTSGEACGQSPTISVWAEPGFTVPFPTMILYTIQSPLSNPFIGSTGWRKLIGPSGTYAVEITTAGEITNYVNCP